MSKRDWFRKTSWSPEDEQDFYYRLKRARTDSTKAQYLRIQAYHLVHDARPPLPSSALRLLNHLINEFPDSFQIAQALKQKAACMEMLSQKDEVILTFRQAIAHELAFPNVKTGVTVDFPFYIVEKGLTELYDEAWDILDRDKLAIVPNGTSPFPITRFRFNTAAALILNHKKKPSLAREHALKALEDASTRHSDFNRHKDLGLVTDIPDQLLRKLKVLASKS